MSQAKSKMADASLYFPSLNGKKTPQQIVRFRSNLPCGSRRSRYKSVVRQRPQTVISVVRDDFLAIFLAVQAISFIF